MGHSSVYLGSSHKRTGICAQSLYAITNRQNMKCLLINLFLLDHEHAKYEIFTYVCLYSVNYSFCYLKQAKYEISTFL